MARIKVTGPDQYCEVQWPYRSLSYPECPYYKELTKTGIDGQCIHPNKPPYIFCGTMHVFPCDCPFDIKYELAKKESDEV